MELVQALANDQDLELNHTVRDATITPSLRGS